MAAPTYVINSSITCHGVISTWNRLARRVNADGTVTFIAYWVNTWNIAQMEVSTFESLRALQGAALTSLATNTPTDRNTGVTYSSGVEVGLVNGQQVGRRMTNVTVEYKVKI